MTNSAEEFVRVMYDEIPPKPPEPTPLFKVLKKFLHSTEMGMLAPDDTITQLEKEIRKAINERVGQCEYSMAMRDYTGR